MKDSQAGEAVRHMVNAEPGVNIIDLGLANSVDVQDGSERVDRANGETPRPFHDQSGPIRGQLTHSLRNVNLHEFARGADKKGLLQPAAPDFSASPKVQP